MEDNIKKKNNTVTLVILFSLLIMIIGFTYAYFSFNTGQTTTNILQSDCLNVEIQDLSEDSSITLRNQFPITDDQAKNLRPYTFKLVNTCKKDAAFQLNLEVLDSDNLLESQYIATKIDENEKKILNTYDEITPTYNKDGEIANKAYKIQEGTVKGGEEKTYNLRLWLNDSVTLNDDVQNKTFKSKLSVTSEIAK